MAPVELPSGAAVRDGRPASGGDRGVYSLDADHACDHLPFVRSAERPISMHPQRSQDHSRACNKAFWPVGCWMPDGKINQ